MRLRKGIRFAFMVRDTPPETAKRYVVLVEEVIPLGSDDHNWQLVKTIPVEGDRTIADARARALAMEHVPESLYVPHGATPARSVFRVADGSWLVEVSTPPLPVQNLPGSPQPSRCTSRNTSRLPPPDDTPPPHKRRLLRRG
ncbi:hypothetical protein AB0C21_42060 [Spirillospora sp. NPDC049024]